VLQVLLGDLELVVVGVGVEEVEEVEVEEEEDMEQRLLMELRYLRRVFHEKLRHHSRLPRLRSNHSHIV